MRSFGWSTALLGLLSTSLCAANTNLTKPLTSRTVLPSTFKPPQVWKNVNLVRNINLDKGYAKEAVNVVIENTDKKEQDEYFLPFEAKLVGKVGGLEVRDKNEKEKAAFEAELVEYDPYSPTQFYRIRLPTPLKPSTQQTLSISYSVLSSLTPLPALISQQDKQYLVYEFSAYTPSAYVTLKQKTKVKFSTSDIPEYTILPKGSNADGTEDPQKQGSTFTYGPYGEVAAGAVEPVRVRYEFTKPLTHATLLERDVEISHWGGNLAIEERYWLTNRGANLSNHFSRVTWATTSYYNPPTSALKELKIPLRVGSMNPYFTDDIGNVSTSRFRSNSREANLELKPRYPVFGGWNYNFRVGWDANLSGFLRKLKTGNDYILKVPFLEGPKQLEGVEYEKVQVRIILPEGAEHVKYETAMPIVSAELITHRTYMDTVGRTALKLTAFNVVDDIRDVDVVVTYKYSLTSGLRKPLTIFVSVIGLFIAAWALGQVDTRIAAKGALPQDKGGEVRGGK